MANYTPQLQSEYKRLFDTCVIRTEKLADVNDVINRSIANQSRYETVSKIVNIPWYFISIIHCMEGSLSFNKHLHNGDSLTARTVHVPSGRPKTGNPPFAWETSAEDALLYGRINKWKDWSVPGMLYKLEGFNGFGYRKLSQTIHSPYLWSYSNHYTKGKFIRDGEYSPTAVSKQMGAAVLLRRMAEKQIVSFSIDDRLIIIEELGEQVKYAPDRYVAKAEELQKLLNLAGAHLLEDGKAGRNTSDAYFKFTGRYLEGDPTISG